MPVHAAPDGVATNGGTGSAPWSLDHAPHQFSIGGTEGRVLLLLDGVYRGLFDIVGLDGSDSPYLISAVPDAAVVVEGTMCVFLLGQTNYLHRRC